MQRLILFLIRRKLHIRKYESFWFTNQKTSSVYWIDHRGVWKYWHGVLEKSHVSANWLLDPECEIRKV